MADNLRQLAFVADTDRNVAKDFAGNTVANVTVVNGDTVLICLHAKRLNYSTGVLEDLNMSAGGAPKALRVTVRETRDPDDDLLTFQDTYNQGDLAAFEDLTKGQVTWKVAFNSANLDALFAAADSASVWLEFSYLSYANIPQTLFQCRLTVVEQLDDGAVGTPPPSSPTYLTAVEIAAAYQPLDAELTALAGLTSAANKLPYFTGAGTAALADYTASARTLTALTAVRGDLVYASGAATWARLAVGTAGYLLRSDGTDVAWASLSTAGIQPLDAELTALAGLTSAADKVPYFTGAGTAALADYTASARTFDAVTAVRGDLVYASGAATWARLAVGTAGAILRSDGTDVAWASLSTAGIQPLDATLTALAGLATAADKVPYFTGTDTAALADYTASARTFDALTAVRGDLVYASGAATWARLAVGTAGAILRSDGTDVAWSLTPSGLTSLSATTLYADHLNEITGSHGLHVDSNVSMPNGIGQYLYNTADEATNYERLGFYWDTNAAVIGSRAAGSGTIRKLTLQSTTASASTVNFDIWRKDATTPFYNCRWSSSASGQTNGLFAVGDASFANSALAATNIVQIVLSVRPYVNQSATAGYTCLLINPTENATGSGAKLLIDAQVGSASKFAVSNAGAVSIQGTQVLTTQQTALTAQLTTITHTEPGTPDYAIQALTTTTPYGFVTADEGHSVLKVIANLQTRVSELETKLKAHGLIA